MAASGCECYRDAPLLQVTNITGKLEGSRIGVFSFFSSGIDAFPYRCGYFQCCKHTRKFHNRGFGRDGHGMMTMMTMMAMADLHRPVGMLMESPTTSGDGVRCFLMIPPPPPPKCRLAPSSLSKAPPVLGSRHPSVVGAMLSSYRRVRVAPCLRRFVYVPHTEPWTVPSHFCHVP